MSKITIYQKPTCTKCRQVFSILKKRGVDFDSINYYFDPIPKEKIEELLFKLKMSAKELMRTDEKVYRELEIGKNNYSEDYLTELLSKNPDLIQRPIVERGAKAVVARPPEKVLEVL